MYTLFIWSTSIPDNTAQGVIDFHSKDSAVSAYRFFFDLAIQGRDKITCITLEGEQEQETLYTATFPE